MTYDIQFTGLPTATKGNKYTTTPSHHSAAFMGQSMSDNEMKLVTASYCSNSWKKNNSAINLVKKLKVILNSQ